MAILPLISRAFRFFHELNFGYSLVQIMIASAFLGVGATLVALQLTALFARLMGARLEDLGVHMTWFWAAAGLARCLGICVLN
jgi:hypothetical protein